MSYILEALNKSERDREIGNVPRLAVAHGRASRRRPRWVLPLALILVGNGVLLAGILMNRGGEVAVPAALGQLQPMGADERFPESGAKNRVSPPVMPARDTGGIRPVVAEVPAARSVATVPGGGAAATPAGMAAAANQASPPPFTEPETVPGVAMLDPAPKMVDQAPASSPGADPSPPVPAATQEPPYWNELDAQLRSRLPRVDLDVHFYTEEPSTRFVLVDLQRYREGDTLADGPVVEEINPEGVVLEYRGDRYRIARH